MIAIIPAAGKGTRFKELGKQYSKTALPYKEKPLLIHQIEWLEKYNCTIRVVINHQEDSVKNILSMYNKNVQICKQENMNGLSGAIHSAMTPEDNEDVLILLGDLVPVQNIKKEYFNSSFLTVQEVPDYSRWCMVSTENGIKFYDKPKTDPGTNKALSGVYYFKNSNKLFNALNDQLIDYSSKINNEFQISTVLDVISRTEHIDLHELEIIDFGTLEEYLKNKSVKKSRSFNDIKVNDCTITKSSSKYREKIIKEYNWYNNIPDDIKINTPRIFSSSIYGDSTSYTMEKILAPSLREIYLFLDSTGETWSSIFTEVFSLLEKMNRYGKPNDFMDTVVQKTIGRIKNIEFEIDYNLVNDFVKELRVQSKIYRKSTLMHGDFCFSNLLYDFKTSRLTMVDPRGEIFGDQYYEIAKLYHSIFFDYDFIDTELYIYNNDNYTIYNNGKEDVKNLFKNIIDKYYTKEEQKYILLLTGSLFISMIPLHNHNKVNQKIFYDVFIRIYNKYKEMK